MSDWVKTQNGWKQSGGNGVGHDEFNEVKSSLNTLERNMDTVLPLTSKMLFSDNIESLNQSWASNSSESYYEIEIKLKQADYLGNKFYNIRINVTARYLGVWSGVASRYEQLMFSFSFNV